MPRKKSASLEDIRYYCPIVVDCIVIVLLGRLHLIEDSNVYSLRDLVETRDGTLPRMLSACVEEISRHIHRCNVRFSASFNCRGCMSLLLIVIQAFRFVNKKDTSARVATTATLFLHLNVRPGVVKIAMLYFIYSANQTHAPNANAFPRFECQEIQLRLLVEDGEDETQ